MPPRKRILERKFPGGGSQNVRNQHQVPDTRVRDRHDDPNVPGPMMDDDKDNNDTIELTIPFPDTPSTRQFLVEFPGYVRNHDKALSTLGSIPGLVSQRATHPNSLNLRLRPEDPYCHPIISDEAKPTNCLVLKLDQIIDGGVDAEVVSVVDITYSFSGPADFQYVGQDLRPKEVQWVARKDRDHSNAGEDTLDPPFFPPQPLLCTPSSFAVEPAIDYAFKQYKASENGIYMSRGASGKFIGSKIAYIDYLAKDVPGSLTGTNQNFLTSIPPSALVLEPWLKRVKELLEARPAYLEPALGASLARQLFGSMPPPAPPPLSSSPSPSFHQKPNQEGQESSSLEYQKCIKFPSCRAHYDVLNALCYRFKNGPWKGAWIRRGYDPRSDPLSKQYQVLDYTLPADWWQKVCMGRVDHDDRYTPENVKKRVDGDDNDNDINKIEQYKDRNNNNSKSISSILPPLASTYASLCSFAGIQSTQTVQLQLCDIEDFYIKSIIDDKNNTASAVNDASGWLTQSSWEQIKSQVARRFAQVWEKTEKDLGPPMMTMAVHHGGEDDTCVEQPPLTRGILPQNIIDDLALYLKRSGGVRQQQKATSEKKKRAEIQQLQEVGAQLLVDSTLLSPTAEIEQQQQQKQLLRQPPPGDGDDKEKNRMVEREEDIHVQEEEEEEESEEEEEDSDEESDEEEEESEEEEEEEEEDDDDDDE